MIAPSNKLSYSSGLLVTRGYPEILQIDTIFAVSKSTLISAELSLKVWPVFVAVSISVGNIVINSSSPKYPISDFRSKSWELHIFETDSGEIMISMSPSIALYNRF